MTAHRHPALFSPPIRQSVENPVEEQLKDPNSGDMKFEDLLRVSERLGGGRPRSPWALDVDLGFLAVLGNDMPLANSNEKASS